MLSPAAGHTGLPQDIRAVHSTTPPPALEEEVKGVCVC